MPCAHGPVCWRLKPRVWSSLFYQRFLLRCRLFRTDRHLWLAGWPGDEPCQASASPVAPSLVIGGLCQAVLILEKTPRLTPHISCPGSGIGRCQGHGRAAAGGRGSCFWVSSGVELGTLFLFVSTLLQIREGRRVLAVSPSSLAGCQGAAPRCDTFTLSHVCLLASVVLCVLREHLRSLSCEVVWGPVLWHSGCCGTVG